MKYLFIFSLALLFPVVYAQHKIQPALIEQLQNTTTDDFVRIRIEFNARFDARAYFLSQKTNGFNRSEVTPNLLENLQNTAKTSQAEVLTFLNSNPTAVKNIRPFWIVNMIICSVQPHLISELAILPGVSIIQLENNRFQLHEKPIIENSDAAKAIDGVEPGVLACNVRPLWAMGYTGRGTKVFIFDTGVWPTHPSYSDRFIGNFAPLSQAWDGYFGELPNGLRSDHGSHVLGTVGGLEKATNDTIGIAFETYWMANDHIGPGVESLPDLQYMMASFEWALNPDGDINTTDDIPDVINNSWRWYDGADMEQCEGIVVELMNVIEAAGIANLFAGGNFGPNNTTISAPQRINTSEVNTFSVGSVNGNMDFPHPLSSFSSKGPTQCPGEGSLAIHPEVVAPGQNVRSAWGQSGYSTISGTSMAVPHVSGVVLLLKEAFPTVSGEEILWAIYLTAIDLGEPGEDNEFGMGMVDAFAAFNYLAQSHTPVNPHDIAFDLSVEKVDLPATGAVLCENSITPVVTIKNKGFETITSIELTYFINEGMEHEQTWSGSLVAGETVDIALTAINTGNQGNNTLVVSASIVDEDETFDLLNNTRYTRFNIRPEYELPYWEGFENGFNNGDWVVNNPDGSRTWDVIHVPNREWGEKSAWMNCYQYTPNSNQRDELVSPFFNLPSNAENLSLSFDVSYLRRASSSVIQDSLLVLVKKSCESHLFDDTLIQLYGLDLAFSESTFWDFFPTSSESWKTIELDISHLAGEQIALIFQTINRTGNNVFLDNVKLYLNDELPLQLKEKEAFRFNLYPNPNQGKFVVSFSDFSSVQNNDFVIMNSLGQHIYSQKIVNNELVINIDNLTKGSYIAVVNTREGRYFQRFIIN